MSTTNRSYGSPFTVTERASSWPAFMLVCASLVFLPSHVVLRAAVVRLSTVSAGAASLGEGGLSNVGQSATGTARSSTHLMRSGLIPVLIHADNQSLVGDIDLDGDVDRDDHALFAACMNGPFVSTPPAGCSQQQFDLADVEGDADVDLSDFRGVSRLFTVR